MKSFSQKFRYSMLSIAIQTRLFLNNRNLFSLDIFKPKSGESIEFYIACKVKKFLDSGSPVSKDLLIDEIRQDDREEALYVLDEILKEPVDSAGYILTELRNFLISRQVRRIADVADEEYRKFEAFGQQASTEKIKSIIHDVELLKQDERRSILYPDETRVDEIWQARRHDTVPSGFPELDINLSGGPKRGQVITLLAPPKGGKTTFLVNIALNALTCGFNVAFFSYEMTLTDMVRRFDRRISGKRSDELEYDYSPIIDKYKELKMFTNGRMYIEELRPMIDNVFTARARLMELADSGFVPDVVVIDYINLITKKLREKRHDLAEVARDMTMLAKDRRCIVWTAALVGRDSVSKPIIRKTDIFESFEIIGVVDAAIAICADDAMLESGLRKLYIACARDGRDETTAGVYKVEFESMTITDLTPKPDFKFDNDNSNNNNPPAGLDIPIQDRTIDNNTSGENTSGSVDSLSDLSYLAEKESLPYWEAEEDSDD